MKKLLSAVLAVLCCLYLSACSEEPEPVDYTDDILGIWYAVEYDEYVNFRSDGIVEDTYNGSTIRGHYQVDNENALLWINFGDDIYSIRITEEDGKIILLDNNGTLVREADRDTARAEYQAEQGGE